MYQLLIAIQSLPRDTRNKLMGVPPDTTKGPHVRRVTARLEKMGLEVRGVQKIIN